MICHFWTWSDMTEQNMFKMFQYYFQTCKCTQMSGQIFKLFLSLKRWCVSIEAIQVLVNVT